MAKLNPAPIFVSVYNREHHFKLCIKSLKNCALAAQSVLFIAIDYPKNESDMNVHKQIVDYAKSISGFKTIHLIIRDKNLGSIQNRESARTEIFSHFDRLIQFEDDNVFAPNFLTFLNHGLEFYQKRKDIFSISGYNYMIKIPKGYQSDCYLWPGFTAWGVGIWKNKWKEIEWDNSIVRQWIEDPELIKKVDFVSKHILINYIRDQQQRKMAGDTIISINLIKNEWFNVFPRTSKVRNIGHDGSGLHSGTIDPFGFHHQPIDTGETEIYFDKDLEPDPEINRRLRNYLNPSLLNRIKKRILKRGYAGRV